MAVPPPERGDGGQAVDALPALLGVARCGRGGGEAAHRGGQLRRAGRAHRDGQGRNLARLRLRGGGELHHAAGILRQRDLRRGEEGEDRGRGVGGGGGQQEGGKGWGGRKVLQSCPRPASSDQPLECCEGGVGWQLGRLCGAVRGGAGRCETLPWNRRRTSSLSSSCCSTAYRLPENICSESYGRWYSSGWIILAVQCSSTWAMSEL